MEPLDLGLERHPRVADQDAGDEDGQEPQSVGGGGRAVDDRCAGEGPGGAGPAGVRSARAVRTHPPAPGADGNRRQPMCMPPSNRIGISAIVTARCTVLTDTDDNAGTRSEATAAAIRKIAGAGTRMPSLILLLNTAAMTATANSAGTRPKEAPSLITHRPLDRTGATRRKTCR